MEQGHELKPLDDPKLQELFSAAIIGALTFGYQDAEPPPFGHWLSQFWTMGREQALVEEARANSSYQDGYEAGREKPYWED